MLLWQVLTVLFFVFLITIAVLAFIEPGPLNRRSRNRRGQGPVSEIDERSEDDNSSTH